jgi:hypothetical protein
MSSDSFDMVPELAGESPRVLKRLAAFQSGVVAID